MNIFRPYRKDPQKGDCPFKILAVKKVRRSISMRSEIWKRILKSLVLLLIAPFLMNLDFSFSWTIPFIDSLDWLLSLMEGIPLSCSFLLLTYFAALDHGLLLGLIRLFFKKSPT